MRKAVLLLLIVASCILPATAQYVPIGLTGFNHDVIAEGGNSALNTTTKEMDAITPSNYVMCTQQFAAANNAPSAGYGLPNNGSITSAAKSYLMGNYSSSNALYLFTTETGSLTLSTPYNYSSISILGAGTEGAATLSIVFHFSDGTTSSPTNPVYEDWFNGTTGIVLQGFGRVKRINNPAAADYGGAPDNPRLYSREFPLPCNKTLSFISFTNVSSGSFTQSNRAFIFAISGIEAVPPVAPLASGAAGTICPLLTATLTVQSPVVGETYGWYAAPAGGAPIATGTSFTTPALTVTTTYYLQATNSCTSSTRTAVTVNVMSFPAAPVATGTTICNGNTTTLTVQSPVVGYTYDWMDICSVVNPPLSTGTSFTTPSLSATTTYYVRAVNSCGMLGTCAPVTVTVAPAITTPVVNSTTICPGSSTTLQVQSPVVGNTYTWYTQAVGGSSIATGNSFTTPNLSAATTYYVQAQDACYTSARVAVTVNMLPPVAVPVVNSITSCSGNPAALGVTSPVPGVTYRWYNSASGGPVIFTGSTLNVITPLYSVTYYVEATDGCSVSARIPVTITVGVTTVPVVNAVTICAGNTAILSVQNALPAEIYRWYTTSTGGSALATGTSFTTPILAANTTYYVEAVNSTACTGPARVAVTVTVIPQLATPVVVVSNITPSSLTFTWTAIPNTTGYEVSVNAGSSWTSPSSGATGTTHTITGLGQFVNVCLVVRAIRTPACAVSNNGTICGKTLSAEIFIPNTFTPNNDGKNDVFRVYGSMIQDLHLVVFNQWGEKLFETKDKNAGWDGKVNGTVQPNGPYVYAAEVTLTDGTVLKRSGTLNIVR